MLIDIVMPRLSDTMEEGAIATWHKAVGDEVRVGDDLVDIETDKALVTWEADEPGVLSEILCGPDETVAIGTPIGRLEQTA